MYLPKISLFILLASITFTSFADFGVDSGNESEDATTVTLDKTKCHQTKLYPFGEHKQSNAGEMLYRYCLQYCHHDCMNKDLTDKTCADAINHFNSILDATTDNEYMQFEDMNKFCQ